MKKIFWMSLGFLFLGVSYVGMVTPGIPWSTPAVVAAYCFARGSPRMHAWIYSHPKLGPFLTNWQSYRIFPTKFKYFMLVTMASSLLVLWFTVPVKAVIWAAVAMAITAVWAWRYPGSMAEHQRRQQLGLRIAWLK